MSAWLSRNGLKQTAVPSREGEIYVSCLRMLTGEKQDPMDTFAATSAVGDSLRPVQMLRSKGDETGANRQLWCFMDDAGWRMDETRKTRPVSWIKAALLEFSNFPEGTQRTCLAALTIAAEGGKASSMRFRSRRKSGSFMRSRRSLRAVSRRPSMRSISSKSV